MIANERGNLVLVGGNKWQPERQLMGILYLEGIWVGKWNPTMFSISASIGSFTCLIFFVILGFFGQFKSSL